MSSMFIFSVIAMPLVPLAMVIGPTVYMLYWLCAWDEDLEEVIYCADFRPSLQVLYENLLHHGRFCFFCIDTYTCSCLKKNAVGSFIVALLVLVLVAIPVFMVFLLIAIGFSLTFGSVFGFLALIFYQVRVCSSVIKLTLS